MRRDFRDADSYPNGRPIMAGKKKTTAKPQHRWTTRGEDLKILGHVEAADEKAALKRAKKQFGAASVELRDEATEGEAPAAIAEEPAAAEPAPKKKGGKSK